MNTNADKLNVIAQLRNELMPLYKQLIPDTKEDQCEFCAQWGKLFPLTRQKEGLMFVGRATNSWLPYNEDSNLLFSELNDEYCIFNRPDQLEWLLIPTQESGYQVHRSSFWNVIRNTTKALMPELTPVDSYQPIVWSNLYKLAPMKGGNPKMRDNLDINRKILNKEIEIFSPKVIVAFVGMNWANDFFEGLKDKTPLTKVWNTGNFESKLFDMGNYHLIVTAHPACKGVAPHVAALTSLIKSIK